MDRSVVYRRSQPNAMTITWLSICGGLVGMVLGYLIANHLTGFDPLEILPLEVPRVVIGR